jgi:hypothetical protein
MMRAVDLILGILFLSVLSNCAPDPAKPYMGIYKNFEEYKEKEIAMYDAKRKCQLTAAEGIKFKDAKSHLVSGPDKQFTPEKLKAAHMDGCAVVEYQLNENGIPYNLHTLHEEPIGYDIANATAKVILASRFMPPTKNGEWYIFMVGMTTNKAKTSDNSKD